MVPTSEDWTTLDNENSCRVKYLDGIGVTGHVKTQTGKRDKKEDFLQNDELLNVSLWEQ